MAGIKIVDLPALGRDLISTDLLELSLAGGTGSRKITGQEIMNASKLSVGNTPIINGAVGQVLFQGTGNVLGESANLFWDNTNVRLGVGTSSPSERFVIDGDGVNITGQTNLLFNSRATSASGYSSIIFKNTNTATTIAEIKATVGAGYTNNTLGFFSQGTERMRIFGATGNVGIGTTTDAGYKLDVNGTFRALVSTETNPFVVQHTNGNFASIVIGNGSQFAPGQFGMYFNGGQVWSWSGSIFRIHGGILSSNANALTFQLLGGFGGSTLGTSIRLASNTFNAGQFTATSGNQNTVEIGTANNEIWAPTSGNATYNLFVVAPRINTSGTYAGIVRGIIYAPTLTSITGVDHRAIETTAGNVIFNGGNVGIGTSSPTYKLDVVGAARFKDTGSNSSVIIDYATGGYIRVNDASLGEAIRLRAGGGASWFNTGQNLLINTTTDAGYRLDVNGTARVTTRIDAGTFTPGAGASAYTIATAGRISAGNGISFRSPIVGDSDFTGFVGAGIGIQVFHNNANPFSFGGSGGTLTTIALATPSFNPSSGTGDKAIFQVAGTYQTSGTYSGAIRGFYYNPTLTSMTGVTAHWAFHSTSGRVRFEGLPTSPTGLNAGDLYNDGGTLKIV